MPTSTKALTTTVQLGFPAFSGGGRDIAFLACAAEFDPRKPFNIVLFFHGFERSLDQQVVAHALAQQVVECRQNYVLVCPRTAVDAATEKNPGKFADQNHFSGFLGELPDHIKTLVKDESLDVTGLADRAGQARLVIANFSAGHRVASTVMSHPLVRHRLAALAFFDSLYQSNAYYQDPGAVLKTGALVGVHRAVYDQIGDDERDNHKELIAKLVGLHVTPSTSIDAVDRLRPGIAVMESVNIDSHWQIVSNGGRLAKVLAKVDVKTDDQGAGVGVG